MTTVQSGTSDGWTSCRFTRTSKASSDASKWMYDLASTMTGDKLVVLAHGASSSGDRPSYHGYNNYLAQSVDLTEVYNNG